MYYNVQLLSVFFFFSWTSIGDLHIQGRTQKFLHQQNKNSINRVFLWFILFYIPSVAKIFLVRWNICLRFLLLSSVSMYLKVQKWTDWHYSQFSPPTRVQLSLYSYTLWSLSTLCLSVKEFFNSLSSWPCRVSDLVTELQFKALLIHFNNL